MVPEIDVETISKLLGEVSLSKPDRQLLHVERNTPRVKHAAEHSRSLPKLEPEPQLSHTPEPSTPIVVRSRNLSLRQPSAPIVVHSRDLPLCQPPALKITTLVSQLAAQISLSQSQPPLPSQSRLQQMSAPGPSSPNPRRKKKKYYVVTRGHKVGIFDDW